MEKATAAPMQVDGEIEAATAALPLAADLENHGLSAAGRVAGVARASVIAVAKNLRRGSLYAFRLVSREHVLSLADQAIVSATGFLTTILIARWSGPTQLGFYALGLSVLLSLLGFQDSLISQPYLIQRHHPGGTPAERAGASLTLSILFSAGSTLVLTVATLGFLKWGGGPEMIVMTLAIAGIVPFALTRDFARRFAFAHLDTGRVVLLDLAAAIIQLSTLGWLGASGRMSAVSACVALGAACAFPTAIWLYYARAEFTFRARHVRVALKQTWGLGKWLLAGRITTPVQGYIIYWLAAVIGGAAVTGVYAACMSIVGFANPLIIGLSNVFMPKSVLAWKHGGGPELWHEAIRNTALIAALVVPLTLAALLAGDTVMRFLYQNKEFESLGHTLTVLIAAMSAGALGLPASNALAAMERHRAIVTLATLERVLTLSLIWILMTEWDLLGGTYGLLAGAVAGAVGRWVAFFMRVPKICDTTSVVRVVNELTKVSDESRWAVTRIGEGHEAEVFVIDSTSREPIWRTHHTLVVKLYKPRVVSNFSMITFESVQAQFNSLCDRHATLDGREINGWRISVPRPLYVCKSPLALVMTEVPGQPIDSYASRNEVVTMEIPLEAAHAVAMAMEEFWSDGQLYGDLGLHNVLLDVERKEISFIDAENAGASHTYDTNQFVVPSDLASFLRGVAMDIMDLNKNSTVRIYKEVFAEGVLLATIERINSGEDNRRLLNDIWFCAQQQLANSVDLSWSPRGAWTRLLRLVAIHRIRSMLERVDFNVNSYTGQSRCEFERTVPLRRKR